MWPGPGKRLRCHGSKRWRQELERGSESISDFVLDTGSLSALIVPMTSGNAARADPIEGSGASLLQNCFWETRRDFETCKRVNETGANSHAGERQSRDGIPYPEPLHRL